MRRIVADTGPLLHYGKHAESATATMLDQHPEESGREFSEEPISQGILAERAEVNEEGR